VTRLDDDQRERYARNLLLPGFGEEAQSRLLEAKVLVVGAGGLGSPVLLYLAAAGVGHLGVADGDAVEAANLQRQVIHSRGSVGTPKTASAAARLRDLQPDVRVIEHGRVTPAGAADLFARHDVVVDCTDTFASKYLVADACAAVGVPLVWGTIVGMSFQVSVFWTAAPAPHPAVSLRDLHPLPPPAGATPSSLDVGVLGAACGQAGSVMAAEAIKLITGVGTPLLGRVLVADAGAGRWDVLPFNTHAEEPWRSR